MARPVRELITSPPVVLAADTTVAAASREMADKGVREVVITGADGQPAGIVTGRDVVTRVIAEGRDPADVTVGSIATPGIVTIGMDQSADDAVTLFREHGVRRLVVVDDKAAPGIQGIVGAYEVVIGHPLAG